MAPMRFNPDEIKLGLQHIINTDVGHTTKWRTLFHQEAARDAIAYIRHLEGELRRQGFTDYNEKEETDAP